MAKLQLMPQRIDDCEGCPLFRTGQLSPDMPTSGDGRLGVMFVGMCQGAIEAQEDTQFVGPSGELLRTITKDLGFDLDRDFWKTNAIRCFVSSRVSIYTNKGYKKLNQIKKGDLVLTHKGRFRKVLSRTQDLPLETRKNKEPLVKIRTKFKTYIVTSSHLFLKNKSWTRAKDLHVGDNLTVLGEKCEECGKIYYKNPKRFDNSESTCSPKCHNQKVNKKRDTRKISASLDTQYKTEVRNKFTITKKANEKTRKLVREGSHNLQHITPEQKRKAKITRAKNRQKYNELYVGRIVGHGEKELAFWLANQQINFYHQFAIGTLNIDFYLPKYNLLIEIENPKSYECNKKIKNKNYKNREKVAKREHKELVFISSKDSKAQLCRILKNHNQQYYFAEAKILDIKIYFQEKQKYLYSLDVEEDHSFIAGGIVHHNCRPPSKKVAHGRSKGREPSTAEINACKVKLFKSIHERKPKIVIPLGKHALTALIGDYVNKITISKFRGLFIPIPEHNFYLAPTIHPSFVLHTDDDYSYATLHRDIKETLSLLKYVPDGHKIEPLDIRKPIHMITDINSFSALMEKIHREKPITAFDYEASSLKPQNTRSRIWSMSICFNGQSYSFPVQYPAVQGVYPRDAADTMWGTQQLAIVEDKIKRYLQDPECKKIAHNESFERIWSHFVLKSSVNSLIWCTMNSQHILDARKAFCGLKLQAFVRWGIHNYDEEIKFYIESREESGANALNQLHRAPLESLLLYGGIDSFLAEKLAQEQLAVFNLWCNKPMHKARILFHKTAIAFTNSQKTGIHINAPYFKKVKTRLTGEIAKVTQEIVSSTEVAEFKKTEQRDFSLTSPVDLRILLFDILKEKSKKKTTTGLDSVDKDVLADLKTPIGKKIIRTRELKKLRDTYIAQYLREEVSGIVYPFLHTHTARSGRSSSSDPNLQNTPERNEKAKKLIKQGIIPTKGNKFVEVDFFGIEINILGCETKDKALLKYLWNPKADMHYDQGKRLFILDDKGMNKTLRYNAKSEFVFLQVYGGKAAASAKYLWFSSLDIKTGKKADGITLKRHLAQQGIRNLDSFTEHVREVESEFWRDFPGIRRWQKAQGKLYLKNGYVETHFGFRRSGYLKWEVILNTQTQSTAAHLLWWCFHTLDRIRIKEKWKTKMPGQIHDSILFDMHPAEEEHVMRTAHRTMTMETVKNYPWIIMPIKIEIEMSEVDQSWYDIKAVPKEYYSTLASKKEVANTMAVLKSRVLKC